MLNVMFGRRAVAALVMLHAAEMIGRAGAVVVAASLARANPGCGMGLAALLLLLAMVSVGWQCYRLLAGCRSSSMCIGGELKIGIGWVSCHLPGDVVLASAVDVRRRYA